MQKMLERKRKTNLLSKVKIFLTSPVHLISTIVILFLIYTIIFPLGEIVINTLKIGRGEQAGEYTLSQWKEVFFSDISEALLYKPIGHTLSIGVSVSILALTLGIALAWVVTRTDIPFKRTIGFLVVLPYMFPSWFKAFAWTIVFKNERIGGSAGLFQYLFQISPPDWLSYGFLPIVLALTTHYYIFSYLLVGAALSSVGGSLEESAEILGASKFRTMRRITFPLVLPAILSALILTISKAIGAFGVPAFLGLPVRYYTLSTMIYNSMGTSRLQEGFILSLVLIIIACIIVYFNQRMISKRNYETIGGKDSSEKVTKLGIWKLPVIISVWGFILVVSIMPVIILAWQTLMLSDGDYSLSNLTLHYWVGSPDSAIGNGSTGVLKDARVHKAFKNSLTIALISSISAALLGLLIGYVITRGKNMLSSRIIDQLSFLPYLIPGIALSAIYLSMFSKPTIFLPALYGTLSILVLITVVKELPFATRAGTSTMIQIGGELEEAAVVSGASWFRRFRRIMLPLSKKGLLSGFILVFISAMKELDLIIMLVTPATNTLTAFTFGLQEQGHPQIANAIVMIVIIVIVVVYLLTTIIGKTDISRGIGGK